MSVYAADLSNYTTDLSVEALDAWKNDGITHTIIQSVDPPPGYPEGKTRGQIAFCAANGMTVDAYIWLWFDLDIADINRKLALLDGLPVRRLWLDVEDTAAQKYSQALTETKVGDALFALTDYSADHGLHGLPGIYTGAWFWTDPKYMGNTTTFSNRDLWTAQYDDIPDTSVFTPYGGWTSCAIKQYHGTMGLHGVWDIDLNVLSDEEAAKLSSGGDMADCQVYKDALERVVNRIQIEDERQTAAGKPATLRRTIIREIAAEAFKALQSP